MHPSSEVSFEERSPAFWDDARMWCLLHQMPWLQLNGSRACEPPYQEHLDKGPGPEEAERILAVRTLNDHVRTIRPDDLSAERSQTCRNYTTSLFVHRGLLTEEAVQTLAAGTVTLDIERAAHSLQAQVIEHLDGFDDGGDLFAHLAWVKSPGSWEELVA